MESLQTPNDFPVVDLWVDQLGKPLVDGDYSYNFQGNALNLSHSYLLNGFFIEPLKPYTQSINIKKLGQDTINTHNINVVAVICPHFNNIFTALENITSDLYSWCESNNVKIAICLMRETISPDDIRYLDLAIKSNLVSCNYSPSIVKIINNAYGIPNNVIYTKYIVPIDTMRRTLKNYIANTINKYDSLKISDSKTYNFSLLTGALHNRWYRIVFLAKCYDLNLLDDKFFYSICILNEQRDQDYIQRTAMQSEHAEIVLKANSAIFHHKTYGVSGEIITGPNMYDTAEEYFIPPQVLDSYIHIVMETVPNVPSLTEKIFKPIVAGLPFIWHGYQNILPYLESLGFKRCSGIDYSFDRHPSPERRLDLLVKEVQRLNTVDLKDLVLLNTEVFKHNQQVFDLITRDYNDLWEHLK